MNLRVAAAVLFLQRHMIEATDLWPEAFCEAKGHLVQQSHTHSFNGHLAQVKLFWWRRSMGKHQCWRLLNHVSVYDVYDLFGTFFNVDV